MTDTDQLPTTWRTTQTPEGRRPSTRDEVRAARDYAERWHKALREWKVASYAVARPASSGRGGAVLLTSGGIGPLEVNYLDTPLGRQVGEVTVARTIGLWEISHIPAQKRHGELLARTASKKGMASLVHHTGRGWADPRQTAFETAVALLTLAVTLRDENAEIHLQNLLNARLAHTILVSSED